MEWTWDEDKKASTLVLLHNNTEVLFHPHGSNGTEAVCGTSLLTSGCHHYWEVKIMTNVGGTDVMVGVGGEKVDLATRQFGSLLGKSEESYGYSYTGFIHHAGKKRKYGPKWGRGAILGVHLDSWHGTLEFYLNRKPLGIAFRGLKNKKLYPMLSSTFHQTGMKLICAQSFRSSLQFSCLKLLANNPSCSLGDLNLPPGLRAVVRANYCFLVGQRGVEEGEDVDYVDTPPVVCDGRLSARPASEAIPLLSSSSDDSADHSVRTLSRKRERCGVQLVSNNETEDSDEEGCFLRIRDEPSSDCGAKLRSRGTVSSRKGGARNKLDLLLRNKNKGEDTCNGVGFSQRHSETSPEKVVKKRFTLKRQK